MTVAEFCALPYPERRKLAWQFFPAALSLAAALGPLQQANDGTPAELGCAFANWVLTNEASKGWCDCKMENNLPVTQAFWHNPDTSAHGWLCCKCHGITQLG